MQLTKEQALQLKMSLELKGQESPTVSWYFKKHTKLYLIITTLFLSISAIYFWFDAKPLGWIVLGSLLTIFLRDLHWYKQFAKGWPLSQEITNWEKVEELLRDHERSAT